LPDKAIDLMDEAGSKVNLLSEGKDKTAIHKKLHDVRIKKEQATKDENYEQAAILRDQETELEKQLGQESTDSAAVVEKELIQTII
ncbi:UvrB/UvrC motif-containing protein, partial [Planococcus sp. SIMBA_143]